jgi:hypothetical protein
MAWGMKNPTSFNRLLEEIHVDGTDMDNPLQLYQQTLFFAHRSLFRGENTGKAANFREAKFLPSRVSVLNDLAALSHRAKRFPPEIQETICWDTLFCKKRK